METHKKAQKYKKYDIRKKALLGIIDILILHWVKKQPLCGKEIRDRIKTEFSLYVGPGTLYPILYQLQYRGFIKAKAYNKNKMYFLTKKGKIISTKVRKDYTEMRNEILNSLK